MEKYKYHIVIVLLAIASYIAIDRQLKRRLVNKSRKGDYNNRNITKERIYYNNLALKLKNAMEGANFSGREIVFNELLSLNDDEFVLVYNNFNRMVQLPETLRTWIFGEYMVFSDSDDLVLERIDRLGLA